MAAMMNRVRLALRELAVVEATGTDLETVARELAVAVITAAKGDDVLVGSATPIMRRGKAFGLRLLFARQRAPLLVMDVIPDALDIATPTARSRFRDAVVAALAGHAARADALH